MELVGSQQKPRRYKHIFLDAEGTLYVPRHGKSRWSFWADPSPGEAVRFFELDVGVKDAIQKLRTQADTVCLVSRNSPPILFALLEEFGLRNSFHQIMLNGDKGKKIERYLSSRGLKKEEALMVGDTPKLDLYPVWKVGVDAVLVDRYYNRTTKAERIAGIRDLPSWLRIADMAEIPAGRRARNSTLDDFLPGSSTTTKRLIATTGT